MNNQLKELYSRDWSELLQNAEGKKAASPLLIKVREEYQKSDIKVMICGQETYGWNGNIGSKDIDFLMNDYEAYLYEDQDYFNTNKAYTDDDYSKGRRLKKKQSRVFWSKKNYKYFEKELTKYFKAEDKTIAFVWNNLSKIGNSGEYKNGKGKATKSVCELERKYFNIFVQELKILKPNIIIFTTGSRDGYIKHHFGSNTEFLPKLYLENNLLAEKTKNLIAEIKLPDFKEISCVRVGHPSRRSLDNSIILGIIKQVWNHQYKIC